MCKCDLEQGIPNKGEGLHICEEGPQEAGGGLLSRDLSRDWEGLPYRPIPTG